MNIRRAWPAKPIAAYTLIEVLVAMFLVGITFAATFTALSFSRIQRYRDKELGITTGFCVHYLEFVKALPFAQVIRGGPINGLYNGGATAVANIRIPTNSAWFSLNDTNYMALDPELSWLTPRNPEMSVSLDTTQTGGVDHTKQMSIRIRWDAPLGLGAKLTTRMDMVRVKDL